MKKPYSFHVSRYPFDHAIKPCALYNTDEYLGNYPAEKLYRFFFTEHNEVVAQVNLYIECNEANTTPYAGFGGLEHDLSSDLFKDFIDEVLHWCTTNGVKTLLLKLPPTVYNNNAGVTENVLLENNFEIISDDLNQHINITGLDFTSIIRKNERKRLRKCRDAGFRFRRMNPIELQAAYELIKNNRLRKGFPITMTFKALEKMYRALPEAYMLFGVFDEEKLIATSVSIHVTDTVLYNFYHGDAAAYRHFSPIVMIIDGVYSYCQQQNIPTLDLGTSSVSGVVNQGLFRFKRNCGGVGTSKKTLRRYL